MLFEHWPEMGVDGLELFVGSEAVDSRLGDVGELLPLQPPYPLHEKLVEIGGKDRQVSGAFEKRNRLVLGKLEHAVIEIEPAYFAIEIFGGVRSVAGILRGFGLGGPF